MDTLRLFSLPHLLAPFFLATLRAELKPRCFAAGNEGLLNTRE